MCKLKASLSEVILARGEGMTAMQNDLINMAVKELQTLDAGERRVKVLLASNYLAIAYGTDHCMLSENERRGQRYLSFCSTGANDSKFSSMFRDVADAAPGIISYSGLCGADAAHHSLAFHM